MVLWCVVRRLRCDGLHADPAEEHIPPDVDLVLLELGINDFFSIEGTAVYERLVRNLLHGINKPAIINIE